MYLFERHDQSSKVTQDSSIIHEQSTCTTPKQGGEADEGHRFVSYAVVCAPH